MKAEILCIAIYVYRQIQFSVPKTGGSVSISIHLGSILFSVYDNVIYGGGGRIFRIREEG